MMTPSKNYQIGLKFALPVNVILIFSFIFLASSSVGFTSSSYGSESTGLRRKLILGSRPPGCVNKCMSCQPCKATLVISPHQKRGFTESSHREDDSYYLLSWRCRCGNRLFHP